MWGGNFHNAAWDSATDAGKRAAAATAAGADWVGSKTVEIASAIKDEAIWIDQKATELIGQAKDATVAGVNWVKEKTPELIEQAKDTGVRTIKNVSTFVDGSFEEFQRGVAIANGKITELKGKTADFVKESYDNSKKIITDAVVDAVSYCKNNNAIKLWEASKNRHYARNRFQADLPEHESDVKFSSDWESEGESKAHNLNGATGNISYRGKGTQLGKQVVYNSKGDRVTDPANEGTYDLVSPLISKIDHFYSDVFPWLIWGNSQEDPTEPLERLSAVGTVMSDAGKSWLGAKTDETVDWLADRKDGLALTYSELIEEIGKKIPNDIGSALKLFD